MEKWKHSQIKERHEPHGEEIKVFTAERWTSARPSNCSSFISYWFN